MYMYVWMYACMHECMYIFVYGCIYACMYDVCMYQNKTNQIKKSWFPQDCDINEHEQ